MQKLYRIADPILWLFLAWLLWSGAAERAQIEYLRTGYKALALILAVVVVIDVVLRLYFWRKDKKLDAEEKRLDALQAKCKAP